jgi:pimeloyl-ACP methyl ester carboxylesterase
MFPPDTASYLSRLRRRWEAVGVRRLGRWLFRIAVVALAMIILATVASFTYNAITASRMKAASDLWKGPTAEIDGVSVAYEHWGSMGPAVILIPGFEESTYVWSALGPRLAEDGYSVWAMDMRGFGYTQRVGPYDLSTWTSQVKSFMDHFGLGKALVVGHSLGAAIAANLALTDPTRVSGIVLVDGDALTIGGPPSWVRKVVVDPYFTSLYRIVTGSGWIMTRILDAAYGPSHPAMTPQLISEWATPLKVEGSESALMQMSHGASTVPGLTAEQLGQVTAPSMVVWGSRDEMDPLTAGREAAGILHSPFQVVPGAGHLSILTSPIAVANMISSFARSLPVTAVK